jgi:hypothetical protein
LASGQKASAYRDGEQIVVWDYDTRKPLYRLSGVDGTVKSLKFSEDDRFLAAIGEGNSNGNDIAIWDMQNGSVAQYVKCTRYCATCMCWGRTVVADPSRRVKTPKYSLFTFHSVQVCAQRQQIPFEYALYNAYSLPCHTVCRRTPQVQVHFLEYDIRTMSYAIKSELLKFPAAGLQRTYHDCCLSPAPGELIAGTSVGEIMVFSTDNLLYRAALPIAANGVFSVCVAGNFLYVGAGDGKVKKLQGNDQYWSIVTEVRRPALATSRAALRPQSVWRRNIRKCRALRLVLCTTTAAASLPPCSPSAPPSFSLARPFSAQVHARRKCILYAARPPTPTSTHPRACNAGAAERAGHVPLRAGGHGGAAGGHGHGQAVLRPHRHPGPARLAGARSVCVWGGGEGARERGRGGCREGGREKVGGSG